MAYAATLQDQLHTDSKHYFEKTLVDQVFDKIPLVYKLRKSKRVVVRGGTEIKVPVQLVGNSDTEHVAYNDALDSNPSEPAEHRKSGLFPYMYTTIPIVYTIRDEVANNGEAQVLDTVQAEVQVAQDSLMDAISVAFHNNANDITTPSKAPHSIYNGCDVNDTLGIYGDIDVTNYAAWAGNVNTDAVAPTLANVRTAIHAATKYRNKRDDMIIITTQSIYEQLETELDAKLQVDYTGMMAQAGFTSFKYQGVEVVADYNCTANYLYVLDLSHWKWYINSKYNFKLTEFFDQSKIEGKKFEWLARIICAHNLVCNKRRANYVYTNMS